MKKITRKALLTAKLYRPGKAGGGSRFVGEPDAEGKIYHPTDRDINLGHFLHGNKVRNKDGDHVPVYHITPKSFSQFKPGGDDPSVSGPVIFLSPNREYLPAGHNAGGEKWGYKEGANVMPLWVNLKNPLVLDDYGKARDVMNRLKLNNAFPYYFTHEDRQALINEGYDGVINGFSGLSGIPHVPYEPGKVGVGDQPHGEEEIVAFHPNQVKSSIGNRGTYDPGEDDINKADGGSILMPGDPQREANLAALLEGNHPLVPRFVYHGQNPRTVGRYDVDENGQVEYIVDQEATDRNIANQGFSIFNPSRHGNYGPGIYLSDSPQVASDYAQGVRADDKTGKPVGNVQKLHVSMKKPFHDGVLKNPQWIAHIKQVLTPKYGYPILSEHEARQRIFEKLDNGTATVRDLFLHDTPEGHTMVNQFGQNELLDSIRRSGFDGIIAHRPDGSRELVAFNRNQVKSATGNRGTFDPNEDDINKAAGGRTGYADGGVPTLKTDNPGGQWLQNKIEDAQDRRKSAQPDTYEANLGTGSGVTGWFRGDYDLPVDMLKDLPGAMGEEKFRDTGEKLKGLKKSIAEHGYRPDPILIHVREDGQPFIVEGNHRVAEAVQSGRKTIPGEIKYLRGAEAVDGPLHPKKVLAALTGRTGYGTGGMPEDPLAGLQGLNMSPTAEPDPVTGQHEDVKAAYPQDVYHGSLDPDIHHVKDRSRDARYMTLGVGMHVAKDPEISNSRRFVGSPVKGSVMPLRMADESKFLTVPQPIRPSGKIKGDDDSIEHLIMKVAYPHHPDLFAKALEKTGIIHGELHPNGWRSITFPNEDQAKDIAQKLLSGEKITTPQGSMGFEEFLDRYHPTPSSGPNSQTLIHTFHRKMREQGIQGLRYTNTDEDETSNSRDDTCYIVFPPPPEGLKQGEQFPLRSRFAKFDPAHMHEPALMKSEGGEVDENGALEDFYGPTADEHRGRWYTGTSKDKDFTAFQESRHGTWFTRDPEEASQYAMENDSQSLVPDPEGKHPWSMKKINTASRVIPAFVRVENPYTGPRPHSTSDNYKKFQSDWFDLLRSQGYDAWAPKDQPRLLVKLTNQGTHIKSAIGNSGAYDRSKKHLAKSDGGYVVDKALKLARNLTRR